MLILLSFPPNPMEKIQILRQVLAPAAQRAASLYYRNLLRFELRSAPNARAAAGVTAPQFLSRCGGAGSRARPLVFKSIELLNAFALRTCAIMAKCSDVSQPALEPGFKPVLTMKGHKLAVSSVKYGCRCLPNLCHEVICSSRANTTLKYRVTSSGFLHVRGICCPRLPIKRCCCGTP